MRGRRTAVVPPEMTCRHRNPTQKKHLVGENLVYERERLVGSETEATIPYQNQMRIFEWSDSRCGS